MLSPWLQSQQPDLGRVRVTNWHRAEGGYSNVTLLGRIEHEHAQPPIDIVLRMQPQSHSVYPDCDIERQYRVMQALRDSEVPVPRLLGFEGDASILGAPFYVMTRVQGQVVAENPLYHQEGWLHDLPIALLRQHWFSGLATVAAIARVDWRARGLEHLAPQAGMNALSSQLAYYHRAVQWAEQLHRPYPHLHRAYEWLLAHQPQESVLALSWGDAKLGNCIFRNGQVVAALDWEMATLANPVDDLAWWLMLDESLSAGYGVPRLDGLPSREESVAYWERASGHSARDLPYYEVYAAWRMAYVMARIGTVFTQRGWVAPELEMDLRNGGAFLLAQHAQRLGF